MERVATGSTADIRLPKRRLREGWGWGGGVLQERERRGHCQL